MMEFPHCAIVWFRSTRLVYLFCLTVLLLRTFMCTLPCYLLLHRRSVLCSSDRAATLIQLQPITTGPGP